MGKPVGARSESPRGLLDGSGNVNKTEQSSKKSKSNMSELSSTSPLEQENKAKTYH